MIIKIIIPFLILLISQHGYSQNGRINGIISSRDTKLGNHLWTILLKQGDSTIKETKTATEFEFKKLSEGIFSLTIQQIGERDFIIDSLKIKKDTVIRLKLNHPFPCIYSTYKKNEVPKCKINGHTKNIVPIIYGMPTQKLLKKSKKGQVHLGGCLTTECDPHYYCILHKIEL